MFLWFWTILWSSWCSRDIMSQVQIDHTQWSHKGNMGFKIELKLGNKLIVLGGLSWMPVQKYVHAQTPRFVGVWVNQCDQCQLPQCTCSGSRTWPCSQTQSEIILQEPCYGNIPREWNCVFHLFGKNIAFIFFHKLLFCLLLGGEVPLLYWGKCGTRFFMPPVGESMCVYG